MFVSFARKTHTHTSRQRNHMKKIIILYQRVTYRLDPVSDAHDQLPVLLHLVDKLHGQHAAVKRLAELLRSCIQSASKTVTLESNRIIIQV